MGDPKDSTMSTAQEWVAPWAADLLEPAGQEVTANGRPFEQPTQQIHTEQIAAEESDIFAGFDPELEAGLEPTDEHRLPADPSETFDLEAPLDAPPPPDPEATLRIRLPADVLVVDRDRGRAERVASRLAAFGYGCRIAPPSEIEAASAGMDAVVLEFGWGAPELDLSVLARIDAAVIVSTAKPLELGLEHVRALGKPWLTEDLVQAIEGARAGQNREMDDAPTLTAEADEGPDTMADPTPEAIPAPPDLAWIRPSAPKSPSVGAADPRQRVTLDARVVRARFADASGEGFTPGRVRAATYDGILEIEVRRPPSRGTEWTVELALSDQSKSVFSARVREVREQGLVLVLAVDAADVPFVDAWVEAAASVDGGRIPPVSIHPQPEVTTPSVERAPAPAAADVEAAWASASGALDDDALQQAFIQACLEHGALELAVRRYRELKEAGDARAERYLVQVGTILGFYAMPKAEREEGRSISGVMKFALGAFLLASLVLGIMASLAG